MASLATAVQHNEATGATGAQDEYDHEIGALIRERREALGITLRAFARQCELSPAHVSKVERGLASPSVGTLTRIIQELDLDPAVLFGAGAAATARGPVLLREEDVTELAPEPGAHEGSRVRIVAQSATCSIVDVLGGQDYFIHPALAPRETVAMCLAGAIEADVEGERFRLEAGDSLVVPANARQAWRTVGGPETHAMYLTPAGTRMLYDEPAPES
jgi:transcriptional regulator with XRE-family HTH domain